MYRARTMAATALLTVTMSFGAHDQLYAGGIIPPPQLVWADNTAGSPAAAVIDGSDRDGSNIVNLIGVSDLGGSPFLESVDMDTKSMYWADSGNKKLWRSDRDSTNVQAIVTAPTIVQIRGVSVDQRNKRVYWTDQGSGAGSGTIKRAKLDGTGVVTVISGLTAPCGIAVSASRGRIFWADEGTGPGTGSIQSAKLNGTDIISSLVAPPDVSQPRGITVDSRHRRIYWTDSGSDKVQRASLTGTGVEDLVTTGLIEPRDIDIIPRRKLIYWTDTGTGKVQRATLASLTTGVLVVEDIVIGLNGPTGLAVENEEPIPTMSQWGLLSMVLLLTIVGSFLFRRNLGSATTESL